MENSHSASDDPTQTLETLVVGNHYPHTLEVNKNYVRLYSHPLCPYAERARLALFAKQIEFQIVDVDQTIKPDWMIELGGTVPILELPNGKRLPESDVTIEYALSFDTGYKLVEKDPQRRAESKLFLKKIDDGLVMSFYSAIRHGEKEQLDKFEAKLNQIEQSLSQNEEGNKYLFNNSEFSIIDIYASPMIVRAYGALKGKVPTLNSLDISNYPHIAEYVKTVRSDPLVGSTYASDNGFINLIYERKKNPDRKLYIPFPETPYEDSQSLKELYIPNGFTAKPLVNSNYLRVYGHRLCPFVERVYLALKAKGIQYQHVAIDLTTKNQWHLDINKGLVPIIELPDGTIIHDSLVITEWLDKTYPDSHTLYPGDADELRKLNETIKEVYDVSVYFIILAINHQLRENDPPSKFADAFYTLNDRLPELDSESPYFDGHKSETMIDLSVFPFVHRALLNKFTQLKEKFYDALDFSRLPRLTRWYDALIAKYEGNFCTAAAYNGWITKQIAANGPKVQLYLPLDTE